MQAPVHNTALLQLFLPDSQKCRAQNVPQFSCLLGRITTLQYRTNDKICDHPSLFETIRPIDVVRCGLLAAAGPPDDVSICRYPKSGKAIQTV